MSAWYKTWQRKYGGKLFCFSPPVMLATLIIELSLVLYTLWRYKLTPLTRVVSMLLFCLAIFQLAEYMICGGLGLSGLDWSRVGFVAITLLPPLGLHIAHLLANKLNKPLIAIGYVSAIAFASYFIFGAGVFVENLCQGNYVIFGLNQSATILYSLYYYGWLLITLWLSLRFAALATAKKQKTALKVFAFGNAAFLLPTTTVNLLLPETLNGIPSIMCGFAVILALIIGFIVLPHVAKVRH